MFLCNLLPRWVCSVLELSPRFSVTIMPVTSEATQEPNLTWFGVSPHVNMGGGVCEDCFHPYVMHTTLLLLLHNNNDDDNRKEQRSCIKDCLSLYGGNIPLFTGRTLNVNTRSTRGRGKTRRIGTSVDQELWHKFVSSVVQPKRVHLFTQRCTLYFSWRNRKSDWIMYACMQDFFSFFFSLWFLFIFCMELLIRETTRVQWEAKVARGCLLRCPSNLCSLFSSLLSTHL